MKKLKTTAATDIVKHSVKLPNGNYYGVIRGCTVSFILNGDIYSFTTKECSEQAQDVRIFIRNGQVTQVVGT